MNAKSDDFDEPGSMAFNKPWAQRGQQEPELWPSEEHERTTVRAFPLEDLEAAAAARDDEAWEGEEGHVGDDESGRDGRVSGGLRRAPRSSSPELPTAAALAMLPLSAHPRRLGAQEPRPMSRATTVKELQDDDPEIEIQVEAFNGSYHGDDADDRGTIASDEAGGASEGDYRATGDATDEDASWWMSIDAGLLAEGSIDIDEDDLPPPLGVIAGTTGEPLEIDRRILEAITAPLELQCSCGCEPDEREQLLRSLFLQLTANESSSLRYRLALARSQDEVARSFAMLPVEHRTRLLDFLDHHARRQAFEGPNWRVIRKG